MASKLVQMQSKAAQASQVVTKNGGSYIKYWLEQNKNWLEHNKHHVQDPPTIENCQLLAKQLFYTRLASIPSRYEALWKELDHFKQLLKNKQEWKVENASTVALFGVECFAWFCGGEIIGRGFTITGYHV